MDAHQHPRLTQPNPLVRQIHAGADPRSVVPDDAVIVRGGRDYAHRPGNVISAQMGANEDEAASGLPHGTVRIASGGDIRAAGGIVELAPEPAYPGGPLNTWHVNVVEGPRPAFPGQATPNPVPRANRLILPH